MNQNINDYFLESCQKTKIENDLYKTYSVKKGLRNEDGTGVLVGLTTISDVVGYEKIDNKKIETKGSLFYRGINVKDIIEGNKDKKRYLFEEVCFLILFGYLPNEEEFKTFRNILSQNYELPNHYLEHNILGFPAQNLMNKLQREVLMLYEYDDNPDSVDPEDILEKGINLIAKIPSIVCYTYHTKNHYFNNGSLIIHQINKDYSIAELILSLLRNDGNFTKKEAEVLDISLMLHADHGGGNNSTFTNVVIASTGTDIYSSIAGSIGSLKGPKHGGANLAVKKQMTLVINDIGLDATDDEIRTVIKRILNKDYNDNTGLIYGIGHAVYTLSDPRSEVLSEKCKELADEKGRLKEYNFYSRFANIAIEEIKIKKGINVCSNVDFYSGLVYDMLNIPEDLYTLLFVVGRTVGWVAHNIENKLYDGRIIRPATKYVGELNQYVKIDER
jgi:citrate synthase